MLRAKKRIVIASDEVNKYGFRTLVNGINLSQYVRNPIMLWMHNRSFGTKESTILPIGNVVDLKVEELADIGLALTGQPVFDDTDEFAVSIFNKYENGTLRMASAGLIPVEWSEDTELAVHGQRGATLVRSILEEVSMVDIGADNNALSVALYDQNHNRVELSFNNDNAIIPILKNNPIIDKMEKIELSAANAAAILGDSDIKTADQLVAKISEVVQLSASQKTQIEALTREKTELKTKLEAQEKLALSAKAERLLDDAVLQRKITADEKAHYLTLAAMNYDAVESLLKAKSSTPSLESEITRSKGTNISLYAGKSWAELDKAGMLIQLKSDDLGLFMQMYRQEFGTEYKPS